MGAALVPSARAAPTVRCSQAAGRAVRGDACELAASIGEFDLAYLDPPYNQHRYVANYHIWETLVAWDAPEHYGVACKRVDTRDEHTKSVFNRKRRMPDALRQVVRDVRARVRRSSRTTTSRGSSLDDLVDMCSARGHVEVLAFDAPRYVGARIGIHNPRGERVGTVSHVRNREYLVIAGDRREARRLARMAREGEVA